MEHDRTGLSDSERATFDALTSTLGEVKVPKTASTVGALRRRRAVLSAAVAGVALLAVVPLLAVSLWLGFAAVVVCFAACATGCSDWVAAGRRVVARVSMPSQPKFRDGRPWSGGRRRDDWDR